MFDIEALEAAGFEKMLTDEEWKQLNEVQLPAQYARPEENGIGLVAGSEVTCDYMLKRGSVIIRTERNTQEQSGSGLQTVVHYPEVAIVEAQEGRRRVACDASDTQLILTMADELGSARGSRG